MAEVFWFKVRNPETDKMERCPRKGAAAAIERAGGEKIWGSAEEIPDAELDADGFYDPPQGRFADLSEENWDIVKRTAPSAGPGSDWNLIELSGEDLNAALDAARSEGSAAR